MTDDANRPFLEKIPTFGEIKSSAINTWMNYLEMGAGKEDIPELIRISTDTSLFAKDNTDPASWAPVHAWRALAQLRASEAAQPLSALFDAQTDNEWVFREIPWVFILLGPSAFTVLKTYMDDASHSEDGRSMAIECASRIGQAYPNMQEEVIKTLEHHLRKFREQSPFLNSCLILELSNMKSADSWWIIKQVFESGRYEKQISGNEMIVQLKLGLKKKEQVPYLDPTMVTRKPVAKAVVPQKTNPSEEKNKAKNRRKQSSKSRSRNRK